jgi:hypothetical protein
VADFAGLDDIPKVDGPFINYVYIPPDTDGAVGLTRIMVGLNNNYRIQDKTTGATISTVSTDTFWSASGGSNFFDPRMLYDPINDRWIVCMLSDAGDSDSSIGIGVSQTSDPAGSYYIFRVDVDATNANWADFPCIGFNKNWVAVNVNMFSISGSSYVNSKVLIVDYTQLRGGAFSGGFATGTGFCSAPAATYTSTENTLYVPTHLSSSGGTYRVDTITGTAGSPVYTVGSTKSRGLTWSVPSGNILPQAAPLSGSSTCGSTPCPVEAQDAYTRSTPVVRDGYLFYAQTVGLPAGGLTHTAVQWTKLDASGGASTGDVLDGGRVEDPTATATNGGKWYSWPHIAANKFGDIVLGFSQFASDQFVSAGYTFHDRNDAAGVMRDPVIYKAGEDYYHKDFGTGRNRWGDYSKAQVDPSNDTDLWVLNEYAKARVGTDDGAGANSSRWGTWWAKLSPSPTEVTMSDMSAERYDDGILLRWQTGMEVRNLGFNVYREDGLGPVRLNPSLLAGSAFTAGTATTLLAGRSYSWWDPQGSTNSHYSVEAIDVSGGSTWHGPVAARRIPGIWGPQDRVVPLNDPGNLQLHRAATRPVQRLASPLVLPTTIASAPGNASSPWPRALAQKTKAVKFSVAQEGWYTITADQLSAAGMGRNINPDHLQLMVDGEEIPVQIQTPVQSKGGAAREYSVQFYAIGIDSPVTDKHTYFLMEGPKPGMRIELSKTKGVETKAESFPCSVERRDRTVYFKPLLNGERENFFGAMVAGPVEQEVTLRYLSRADNRPAAVEIALQGITDGVHRVAVQVNNEYAGTVEFAGMTPGLLSAPLSAGTLREETNLVRLTPIWGSRDVTLVDHIRITYPHLFVAEENVLRFLAKGGERVSIGGFTTPQARVMDVTNPAAPFELEATVSQRPDGGFDISTASSGSGERVLFAFAESAVKSVSELEAWQPSSWGVSSHKADLIILTRRGFFSSLEPLKRLRENQGYAVEMVDVEDLYEEFNYGQKSPQAVKDFLAFAHAHWIRPPHFVLIAGEASYDPKNYLGFGDLDQVPTKLIDTSYMETASDDWLADFNDDGVPEMAVGRLPFRTLEQAAALTAKVITYETSEPAGKALLVSDINDTFDFESESNRLRSLIPAALTIQTLERAHLDPATAKSQLLAAINEGPAVVHYLGHGSEDLWRGNLLGTSDIASLNNGSHLPLFVMMTCLNGYFSDPERDSLAESLLKSNQGGAVAAWASSAVTQPEAQMSLSREFFRLLFGASGEPMTIGDAAAKAKAAVKDADVRRTWILLGDPMIKLRLPWQLRQ